MGRPPPPLLVGPCCFFVVFVCVFLPLNVVFWGFWSFLFIPPFSLPSWALLFKYGSNENNKLLIKQKLDTFIVKSHLLVWNYYIGHAISCQVGEIPHYLNEKI